MTSSIKVFESVNETLKCYYSNESCGTVYYVVQDAFSFIVRG